MSYLSLSRLSKDIQECIIEQRLIGNNFAILDIGCGTKPYRPFFSNGGSEYIGIDLKPESKADMLCMSEYLPFRDKSFDVALCTQVLEHVSTPQDTIREIYRVLKEDGILILSTPGTWCKHGEADYWRWTDLGLRKMLVPFFKKVEVRSNGGSCLALFQILNFYVTSLPFGRSFLYLINNILGSLLDKVFWDDRLIINYLVVAKGKLLPEEGNRDC